MKRWLERLSKIERTLTNIEVWGRGRRSKEKGDIKKNEKLTLNKVFLKLLLLGAKNLNLHLSEVKGI